ncbi:hypothetical protein B0H19DRAFT_1258844 [Mycena capillaripes]|nr:hypothetical protein B0H19DRAFT_1258844 [Mycena capillaripes]
MSAENTPLLAAAIPSFELFMASWNAMLAAEDLKAENIEKFIQPGLAIATKYYNKMGDTDAYIIAMFINPSIRFEWIRKNWSRQEQDEARGIIFKKLQSYEEKAVNSRASSPVASGSGSAPAVAGIAKAAKRFRNVGQSLDFTAATSGTAKVNQSIEDKLNHYISSPIPPRKSTDMIGYWLV